MLSTPNNMQHGFTFALRQSLRDWRNKELQLLFLALALAVSAITAVGFFTDRIEQAMRLQANEMLAADLVYTSSNPIPDSFIGKAIELGLERAKSLRFPSVVMQGDQTLLVGTKAISPEYPLRGLLYTRHALDAPEQSTAQTPPRGEMWVGARVLASLALQVGDQLSLGEKNFKISRILSRDSSEGFGMFRLGPSVMIALADIPDTGLVTAASRVRHQLLLAGSKDQLEAFHDWAADRLPRGSSLQRMSNARPELRGALDRGSRFLALAALVTVLIAGAAVVLATRRFVERQSDASAIMRCLGASRAFVLKTVMIRLLLLTLAASLLGSTLGYFAQFVLVALVGEMFTFELPSPGPMPLFIGLGTGLITLAGFTLPSLLRLGSVPPLRVLRRALETPPIASWIIAICALIAIFLLLWWQAGEVKLALFVAGGALITVILLIGAGIILVWLLTPLRHHSNSLWRYGLAGLARAPGLTALQLAGFGLGILALLLLTVVRFDLMATWEKTIPPETPNQFLINIQPHEVHQLEAFLTQRGVASGGIYPMLRARLIKINDREISPSDYEPGRARRLLSREFNLSWAGSLQEDNRIVTGTWWNRKQWDEGLFSVEKELAETLAVNMDDRLTFDIAGAVVAGRVSSLRTVQWDSFKPNFFVIGTPELLKGHPASYITSFYLPPGQEKLAAELLRRFPAITLIDVSTIMQQIRDIISRGSLAVEYVFMFTLVAGLLVLYAGIQANREHRRQESAILRTLGLQRGRLLQAVAIEFVTLGALAGLLAALCASLTGWVLATELFELDYQFSANIWLLGISGGGLGVGIAGILVTWPLVIHPPLQTLRE